MKKDNQPENGSEHELNHPQHAENGCSNCHSHGKHAEGKSEEGNTKLNSDSTVSRLQKENDELKKQFSDMKETLQRVYAEFQNYKRRTEEDKQKNAALATEDLLKRIFPIIDNLELALRHKKCDDDFSKGVELIYAQFIQVLEDEGVKVILSNGKYNPLLHEVLMTESSEKEEGVILEEFQKGYTLGGKVLRHSKVKIAKHKEK